MALAALKGACTTACSWATGGRVTRPALSVPAVPAPTILVCGVASSFLLIFGEMTPMPQFQVLRFNHPRRTEDGGRPSGRSAEHAVVREAWALQHFGIVL